jgi:hypothetical protein
MNAKTGLCIAQSMDLIELSPWGEAIGWICCPGNRIFQEKKTVGTPHGSLLFSRSLFLLLACNALPRVAVSS